MASSVLISKREYDSNRHMVVESMYKDITSEVEDLALLELNNLIEETQHEVVFTDNRVLLFICSKETPLNKEVTQ